MDRRTLLGTLAAGAAATGGCLQESNPETPGTANRDGTPTDPASTDGGDGSAAVTITNVTTYSHAIRLNDLGSSPRGQVPRLADLEERERSLVEAAIDDGREIESLSPWQVEFLRGTPIVRRQGTYYRLDADLPTTTITAEAVERGAVAGEIAGSETYDAAVTHDGRVASGLMRSARDGGERLTAVWPSLRDFLDRYDAVEYRGEVLDFSVSTDDPGSPYAVTASEASLDDVAGGDVWRLSEATSAVQSVVRSAAAESGLSAVDDPPDGLIETLRAHQYVYVDGRFYTTYVEQAGPQPLSMDATVEDGTLDDGARIRLAVRNDGNEQVTTSSGIPKPFGVVRFRGVGAAEPTGTLWTDAYEATGGVQTENGRVVAVNSVAVATELPVGETAGRTFTLRNTALAPGEYVIAGSVGYSDGAGEDGTLPYEIRFRVEADGA
jgi:hypothetical protein